MRDIQRRVGRKIHAVRILILGIDIGHRVVFDQDRIRRQAARHVDPFVHKADHVARDRPAAVRRAVVKDINTDHFGIRVEFVGPGQGVVGDVQITIAKREDDARIDILRPRITDIGDRVAVDGPGGIRHLQAILRDDRLRPAPGDRDTGHIQIGPAEHGAVLLEILDFTAMHEKIAQGIVVHLQTHAALHPADHGKAVCRHAPRIGVAHPRDCHILQPTRRIAKHNAHKVGLTRPVVFIDGGRASVAVHRQPVDHHVRAVDHRQNRVQFPAGRRSHRFQHIRRGLQNGPLAGRDGQIGKTIHDHLFGIGAVRHDDLIPVRRRVHRHLDRRKLRRGVIHQNHLGVGKLQNARVGNRGRIARFRVRHHCVGAIPGDRIGPPIFAENHLVAACPKIVIVVPAACIHPVSALTCGHGVIRVRRADRIRPAPRLDVFDIFQRCSKRPRHIAIIQIRRDRSVGVAGIERVAAAAPVDHIAVARRHKRVVPAIPQQHIPLIRSGDIFKIHHLVVTGDFRNSEACFQINNVHAVKKRIADDPGIAARAAIKDIIAIGRRYQIVACTIGVKIA